jgi:3-oxoacyl-[acyl-carrier-protein] synthase II
MLAGAAEACIHPLALGGFSRARSLATKFNDEPEHASRPFDRARDGFVIAEGAAVLVLEELEHARKRGAKIYAEMVGYGLASDAYHITAPHPDGRGAYLSMERALADAGLGAREVDWVNAHATGTKLGDAAENRAVRRIMVEQTRRSPTEVNVSSVKGAVGHLLGASGALEGLVSALAVNEDVLPPTINLEEPGDGDDGWDMNYVALQMQERKVDVVISNSFGFGGTCATLCFKKFRG